MHQATHRMAGRSSWRLLLAGITPVVRIRKKRRKLELQREAQLQQQGKSGANAD